MSTQIRHTAAKRFALPLGFRLESGAHLPGVEVAYRTWGRLSEAADNAVVVCHPLTEDAQADRWWRGLLGPGLALDPRHDYIVCSNVLGGCHGTTGPIALRPGAGRPYGPDFPAVSVRDLVRLQIRLLDALGVRFIRLVIGPELGGQQALEWAFLDPVRVGALAVIAASGRQSAWGIGWHEAQRQAIYSDPGWRRGRFARGQEPVSGLGVARMIAQCGQRSPENFASRFGRQCSEHGLFDVEHFLHRKSRQFVSEFDANSFVALTLTMDSHDVAAGRGAYHSTLRSLGIPALVVGFSSDLLCPLSELEELAGYLPRATFARLDSPCGNEAFLLEPQALNSEVAAFRAGLERPRQAAEW